MTDPFLLSAGDDEPPAQPTRRAVELGRRLGLPRTVLDIVPLEVMEEPGSFENTVSEIMQPALQAILVSCGFATQMIPENLDYAGYLLVAGRTAPRR